MKKQRFYSLLLLIGLAIAGCKPDIEEVSFYKGDFDLSRYVAIGDHVTAGYMNGGVSRESQQYTYPAILAQQFALVGGDPTFNQPLFDQGAGTGRLVLQHYNPQTGELIMDTVTTNRQIRNNYTDVYYDKCAKIDSFFLYPRYNGNLNQLNNYAVPGLKLAHIKEAGTGNESSFYAKRNSFNPFYERILPENSDKSYLQTVTESGATFYTVWLGMSDVIPYAFAGAAQCSRLPRVNEIEAALIPLIDSITKSGAKVALANQISFSSYSFVRSSKPLELEENLKQKFNDPNLSIWVQSSPAFIARRIDPKDILLPKAVKDLLNTSTASGYGLDSLNPVVNADVIDQLEAGNISNFTRLYNTTVDNIVSGSRTNTAKFKGQVILVDLDKFILDVAGKISINGAQINSEFPTGNLFSLDGFTLTPRGHALIANQFITSINQLPNPDKPLEAGFGANIPRVNINDYPGTVYP